MMRGDSVRHLGVIAGQLVLFEVLYKRQGRFWVSLSIIYDNPSTSPILHTVIMHSKKVLVILSDAHSFPLQRNTGHDAGKVVDQPSGYFLQELAKPLNKILNAGHEVTFASPQGREPAPDPSSESLVANAGNFYERQREYNLIERMKRENGFRTPRSFSTISNDELTTFAAVFIPGEHAPLRDLAANAELGRILRYFHQENKPTAVICHGPYALLSTKKAGDGSFVYNGYKITSWSDAEENLMETDIMGWRGRESRVDVEKRRCSDG